MPPLVRQVPPRLAVVGDSYTMLLTAADTRGTSCIIDALIPPGGGPPPHIHTREDECFVILDGTMTFVIGDQRHTVSRGGSVFAPRGLPHRFLNDSDAPARMLITITPAGFEQMFYEIGTPLLPGQSPPPFDERQVPAIIAAAARYGCTILPPPA